MASIGDLPPEVLTRIFRRLHPFEWLLLENVCWQWKDIAVNVLWRQLRCVDEEGIGFPNEDFDGNFIEIAKRIRSVKRFINPLGLVGHSRSTFGGVRGHSNKSVQEQLKASLHQLVSKKSRDAVFPLDLIKSLLNLERCGSDVNTIRDFMRVTMKKFHVADFSAIRLDKVFLHQKVYNQNPLAVTQLYMRGLDCDDVSLPLDPARVTRIVIRQLAIRVSAFIMDREEALDEIAAWKRRFSSFPNLQHVEVESIQLVMPSNPDPVYRRMHCSPECEPLLSMLISLVEGSCVFAVGEFKALLDVLSSTDEKTRTEELVEKIRKWEGEGAMKGAAIRIHSDMFEFIEPVRTMGRDHEWSTDGREGSTILDDPVKCVVAELFPKGVDKVHLTISTGYKKGEHLVSVLRGHGVFGRVKEFSVTYVQERTDWVHRQDSKAFLTQAYNVIQPVCDEMTRLEVLRLDLTAGGHVCAFPKLANVPMVKQPLPLLQLVEINGFPCFSFLSSIVQHAVNLKQLVINSQPFSNDCSGLQRMIKFLESMQVCRNLAFFSLKAWDGEDPFFAAIYNPRPPRSEQVECKLKPMLAEVERHLIRLDNTMPNLVYIAVIIGRCQFKYAMDRRGR